MPLALAVRGVSLGMGKYVQILFAVFLCAAFARPIPAYSDTTAETSEPSQETQDAFKKEKEDEENWVKNVIFGDDPVAAYAILTWLALRTIALKDVPTQVAGAIQAREDNKNYEELRKDFLEYIEKVESIKKREPVLFDVLNTANVAHARKLYAVEQLVREIDNSEDMKSGEWRKDLGKAIQSWNETRDVSRLEAVLERYKELPSFQQAMGDWQTRFEDALTREQDAAKEVAKRANAITELFNKGLPFHDRIPKVSHADDFNRHSPGVFHHFGSQGEPVRLSSTSLVTSLKERCEVAMKLLKDQSDLKWAKGSYFAPSVNRFRMALPFVNVGTTAGLTVLTVRNLMLGWKNHGPFPVDVGPPPSSNSAKAGPQERAGGERDPGDGKVSVTPSSGAADSNEPPQFEKLGSSAGR